MKCPKCRKIVLMITRHFKARGKIAKLEIHHDEDAKRWNLGAATRVCNIRVSFEESQDLMRNMA